MQNSRENMFTELSEDQCRQLINAQSVHEALLDARIRAAQYKGSMFWRNVGGIDYLIRRTHDDKQRSLGVRTPENAGAADKFMEAKQAAEERVRSLSEAHERTARMNKALRVGRVPNIVVDTLNTIERFGLGEFFVVVGTHALYAYETAAAVRIPEGATATQDVDLLFDTRKRLQFVHKMGRLDESFLDVLRKVDKSFQLIDRQLYTARNKDGFEIDVIRRAAGDSDPHPLKLTDKDEDFWAVQTSMGERLLGARQFSQVVVATNGSMAKMRTVHPMDFARIKEDLAKDKEREQAKVRKDKLQASVALELVRRYLPNLDDAPHKPQLAEPEQSGPKRGGPRPR